MSIIKAEVCKECYDNLEIELERGYKFTLPEYEESLTLIQEAVENEEELPDELINIGFNNAYDGVNITFRKVYIDVNELAGVIAKL